MVRPACDQPFLDPVDDLVDVEHDLVALQGHRTGVVAGQDPLEGLLGAGVDPDPEVGELVGGDERAHLALHETVDGCRERADELLQARRVGDHAGEDVVEDRLDVDLLLDRFGDPGRDDVLDLG